MSNTVWGDISSLNKAVEEEEVQKTAEEIAAEEAAAEASAAAAAAEEEGAGGGKTDEEIAAEAAAAAAVAKAEEEKAKPKPADEEESSDYEVIASTLEDSELLILDEDSQYDDTKEGFIQMMKDSQANLKSKMDADFKKREAEIRAELASANKPKFADMSVEDDTQAESMIRQYLTETDWTSDEIEEKITGLKEAGSLEKDAKVAQRFLSKNEKNAEEAATAAKAKEAADAEKQRTEYIESIKEDIQGTEELAGFKLTPQIKKKFTSYLFDVDKDGKSAAMRANEADEDRRIRVAFLDFMDYNKKDFELKATTAVSTAAAKGRSRFKQVDKHKAKAKGSSVSPTGDEVDFSRDGIAPNFFSPKV